MIEQQLISPAASIQSCIGIDTTFAPDNLSDNRICLDTLKLMGTLVTLGTPLVPSLQLPIQNFAERDGH